jgi:2,4-dienoyl-CoA reductase (NADPH2)
VYLLRQGEFHITLVEGSGRLGRDVSPFYLWRYLKLFRERGVVFMTRAELLAREGDTVRVASPKGEKVCAVDDIVVATREAHEDLGILAGAASETFVVGDAKRPRRLHNAIHDGYRLGMKL